MLSNPTFKVDTLIPINEHTLIVTCDIAKEASTELPIVNVVKAAYVTALARSKLYRFLEMVGNRLN